MKQQREHWGTRIGFIMATAGSAIGLGSLWRFPYICGMNGGGAFVLLYLLFTFLIGIPIFMAELVIGRASQRSAVKAYDELAPKSTHWKLLGWLNLITSLLILSYYTVVSGWAVNYALMSLNQFFKALTPAQISNVFDVLYVSGDINVFWHLVFIIMTVGVVYGGVRKGIEYWSRILTPALLIILVLMFIYSTTLPGVGQAFKFILYPDFSKITADSILNALGMSFFTLSVGLGIILTYGSYMKPTEDIPRTGLIIGSVTVGVSLMAALMIFPIIFSFGFKPEEGFGLVFKTLPILFAKMPGALVISTVFFILFIFTALTSSISLLEVIAANLIEIFNWTRKKAVIIAGSMAFVLGIPSALSGSGKLFGNWTKLYGVDFFTTINNTTGNWMMPIGGLMTVIFAGWVLKKSFVSEEFLKGTKMGHLLHTWLFCIRYLAPIAVFIVFMETGGFVNINALIHKIFN